MVLWCRRISIEEDLLQQKIKALVLEVVCWTILPVIMSIYNLKSWTRRHSCRKGNASYRTAHEQHWCMSGTNFWSSRVRRVMRCALLRLCLVSFEQSLIPCFGRQKGCKQNALGSLHWCDRSSFGLCLHSTLAAVWLAKSLSTRLIRIKVRRRLGLRICPALLPNFISEARLAWRFDHMPYSDPAILWKFSRDQNFIAS